MSGSGFAGSGGCVVPMGVQGVPRLWLMGDMQLEQTTTLALPECPGSPLALPGADGHMVGVGGALEPAEGGWKPGGTHSTISRQLCWIKTCVLTPFSKERSPWLQGS